MNWNQLYLTAKPSVALIHLRSLVQVGFLLSLAMHVQADLFASEPNSMMGDARLCFGNGHVLGAFVGPMEFPEKPIYKVHDKISRLWLGYSSPMIAQVDLAPTVINLTSGERWTVGAVDHYWFEDGVIIMETALPCGTVRTETYGLWNQPVLVRRIIFESKVEGSNKFLITTTASLYREHSNAKPTDPEGQYIYKIFEDDLRELPPSLTFPNTEKLQRTTSERVVEWTYDDSRYRDVVITTEEDAKLSLIDPEGVLNTDNVIACTGAQANSLQIERMVGSKGGSLTVILAFHENGNIAKEIIANLDTTAVALKTIQHQWQNWFEKGAVVTTGHERLDRAYRVQMMYLKVALDAELGGHIVGGRYQIPTVWVRDPGVAMSVLNDAGHYEEVQKILTWFSKTALWNKKNNCLHANYHSSGRAVASHSSPGQPTVEDLLQPGAWTNQMHGPQLDGMGYYLYGIGKYHRYTNDTAFIREQWPFIVKVANSLAADDFYTNECVLPHDGYDEEGRRVRKYHRETGLIVDNSWESDILGEYSLANVMAVLGFREAFRLSKIVGDEKPSWQERANSIETAIREHLIQQDSAGRYIFIKQVPRPWLNDGQVEPLNKFGYPWTVAATAPLFNYRDETFKQAFARQVDPKGNPDGWGMWYATTAHAAFEADLADVGWNYLSKLADRLPDSLQAYEHHQTVTGFDGVSQEVSLNLFSFAYLPHAMIRGMLGFGYDENAGHWFFRPQIPDEIGTVHGQVRINKTRFEITASGNGSLIEEFKIDNHDLIQEAGVLPYRFLDGSFHRVIVHTK